MRKTFFVLIVVFLTVLCIAGCSVSNAPVDTQTTDTPGTETEANAAETAMPAETDTPEPSPEQTDAPAETETPEPAATPETGTSKKTVNVVYNKPVTTDYDEHGQWGNKNAIVDEDETTRWSGFDTQRQNWSKNLHHEVTVDLQGRFLLKYFYIAWETLTGCYKIYTTENGTDWTEVFEFDDCYLTATAVISEEDFPDDTYATMVRIVVDFPEEESFQGYPYCSIYEFECYGCEADDAEQ